MAREKVMAPQRTIVSMQPELKEAIATFRHSERIGTEAEAIRQLITEALAARGIQLAKATKSE